ncbi:MAG: shikimate dehydrogenase [Bacteroidales bacterium]|nr:MAG: shikimate dehydrogenase [Bacteroidales bacterium]
MKKFGLIGYPLSHSFSMKYFSDKFKKENIEDCQYLNFPIDTIEKLPSLISENKNLIGLNVTIPYKEKVIGYLNEIDETSGKIGAVNTIKIRRVRDNYTLSGYNTDAYGFHTSIVPHIKKTHKKALILGTGGASKAIAYVFEQLGIDYIFVSRKPKKANHISYNDITGDLMSDFRIIVNTSPLGMYPDVDKYPYIPYKYLTSDHLLYDLVYNPEMSKFLEKGSEKGAITVNGLLMLHLQAEKAWEIWNREDQ